MSQFPTWRNGQRGTRKRVWVIGAMVSMLGAAGCDTLLDVDLPGTLPAENLRNPNNAPLLVNSVQAMFECFFGQYVGGMSAIHGEAIVGSQRAGRHFWGTRQFLPYEGRGTTSNTINACDDRGGSWNYMGTSYNTYGLASDIATWFDEWTDEEVANRAAAIARVRAYRAYTTMLWGESVCAGAVLAPDAELSTPRQVMAAAEEEWTLSLAAARQAGVTDVENLALVGRARTRLNRGNLEGAAADALLVPEGFRFDATFGTHPQRENRTATEFDRDRHYAVAPEYRNMTVDGVPDPRVVAIDIGRAGIDGRTPIWSIGKYPGADSPIRMASWQEAQLIIAEARLGQEAIDRINAVRDVHELPHATNPGNDAAILDMVLEERRREFFFEGQRYNDMLRHFHVPSIRNAWPEGLTHDGNPIFERYCHPFPEREIEANPNVDPDDIPASMHPDIMLR